MSFRNRLKSVMFPCLSFVSDSSVACELPDSVIHVILLMLPIKSIIRCRRVCKAWYRLISDPYFTKLYFNTCQSNAIAVTQHWKWKYPQWSVFVPLKYVCTSYSYLEIARNRDVTHKLLNMGKTKTRWTNLIGSCDGLLCLLGTQKIACFYTKSRSMVGDCASIVRIANPLIGECMALPEVYRPSLDRVVYGFGSTADGDLYKVVRVAMSCLRKDVRVTVAQIITIGVDKVWREVDISSIPLRLYSHGVILNGVLHWIGDGGTKESHGVIYAFDILTEKGQCFKLPCAIGRRTSKVYLGVWNGHLCITGKSKELQTNIWTMKQYGLADSWSRDIVLTNSIPNDFSRNIIPITTLRNGHLLLSCAYTRLFSCDPKTMNCVEFRDYNITLQVGFGYNPSFISLCDVISKKIPIRSS